MSLWAIKLRCCVVVAAVLGACGGAADIGPVSSPEGIVSDPADTADPGLTSSAIVGTLTVSADEKTCLSLDVYGIEVPVIWPEGYSIVDDPVRLLDADGKVAAKPGDRLLLHGRQSEEEGAACVNEGEPFVATDVSVQNNDTP